MPHLVRERRAPQGRSQVEIDRRRKVRSGRSGGIIPERDLNSGTHLGMAHRLAVFGIDAEAAPLLSRRKRGS
jgi:hypothetical protein